LKKEYFPETVSLTYGYRLFEELSELFQNGNQDPASKNFRHIEIIDRYHMTGEMVEFFLKNKLKLLMDGPLDAPCNLQFVDLMKRLGFSKDIIKDITKPYHETGKERDRLKERLLKQLKEDYPERYLKALEMEKLRKERSLQQRYLDGGKSQNEYVRYDPFNPYR
jgi:hypothetical protein